ncbi:MAG: head-tail adaptor protein [Sphingomonadaceae bacterium]
MGEVAGALKARVDLWRRDPSRDPAGSQADAWLPAGTVWARIEAERPAGASDLVADARHSAQRWRLTLRARPGLGLGMRATWRGLDLVVTGIGFDPDRPGLVLLKAEDRSGAGPD